MDISKIKQPKQKNVRPVWVSIIDWGLLIILIGTILTMGKYSQITTVDTCYEIATNCKGDEKICKTIMEKSNQILMIQNNPYEQMTMINLSTGSKSSQLKE